MKTLVVVSAGLSEPSTTRQVAEQIADATVRQVTASGEGLEVRIVDLRTLATDLATFMTTVIATPELAAATGTVTGADALIVATPVFQGSYSGLFKMFFDTLDTGSLEGVPVTVVATAGTLRHSMVLDYAVRPLLSFLHAVVLPTGVFVATEEFGGDTGLARRILRAAAELAAQLTSVDGVAGFTPGYVGSGADTDDSTPEDAEFHAPASGFAALLAGHSGE